MKLPFSESELEAYLDEALPVDEMSRVEQALRDHPEMLEQLSQINRRRDLGTHTLGAIWRRHRISCPPREQLGSYLLDVLDAETANYIFFHLTEIGCRLCQANLADMREQQEQADTHIEQRRSKYFQSSVGYLGRD